MTNASLNPQGVYKVVSIFNTVEKNGWDPSVHRSKDDIR